MLEKVLELVLFLVMRRPFTGFSLGHQPAKVNFQIHACYLYLITFNIIHTIVFCEVEKELKENPAQMKEYVLKKLENMASDVRYYIENTKEDAFLLAPLRYRNPWEVMMGNVSRGNVCVGGDAFHPMTPDLGQGGCCALEDGVILARCLAEAFSKEARKDGKEKEEEEEEEEQKRIEESLKKYAKERRWRSIDVIATAYVVGFIQQAESNLVSFLRDKVLASFLAIQLFKKSSYDCGKLDNS
ncbi:Monooxygenase 2 [Vigna angularis]|uniref:Monooxygenase 2 n=1 Tax=Phaseolus angularis TaxID=3914 RepID=A0A8T0KNS9_PHAAN|nr:Monooxygenase 2 [Vigna angularis]